MQLTIDLFASHESSAITADELSDFLRHALYLRDPSLGIHRVSASSAADDLCGTVMVSWQSSPALGACLEAGWEALHRAGLRSPRRLRISVRPQHDDDRLASTAFQGSPAAGWAALQPLALPDAPVAQPQPALPFQPIEPPQSRAATPTFPSPPQGWFSAEPHESALLCLFGSSAHIATAVAAMQRATERLGPSFGAHDARGHTHDRCRPSPDLAKSLAPDSTEQTLLLDLPEWSVVALADPLHEMFEAVQAAAPGAPLALELLRLPAGRRAAYLS